MAIDKTTLIPVHPTTLDQRRRYLRHAPELPGTRALVRKRKSCLCRQHRNRCCSRPPRRNYQTPGYPLPPQLFSHADQQGQWQYGQPTQNGTVGWAGLAADRLSVLNPGMTIPMSISLNGQNRLQAGQIVQPYSVTSSGPAGLGGYSGTIGTTKMNALERIARDRPIPTRCRAPTSRRCRIRSTGIRR